MIRVFIADDHTIVRQGLKQIFSETSDIAITAEASDAQQTMSKLLTARCDVLMLDINMPGRSGFDILKPVKELYPDLAVLVFSMHPEKQFALRVLKAGASGYLSKDSEPDQILEAVRHVAGHRKYSSPTLAESISDDTDGQPLHAQLSEREYEVMRLIGQGNTVTEIANLLALSVKTVSTYRRRIMHKMVWRSNSDIMRYVLQQQLLH